MITKADLLKAIADAPDDAPVTVLVGSGPVVNLASQPCPDPLKGLGLQANATSIGFNVVGIVIGCEKSSYCL